MVKRVKLKLKDKFRSDNYRLRHIIMIRALCLGGAASDNASRDSYFPRPATPWFLLVVNEWENMESVDRRLAQHRLIALH